MENSIFSKYGIRGQIAAVYGITAIIFWRISKIGISVIGIVILGAVSGCSCGRCNSFVYLKENCIRVSAAWGPVKYRDIESAVRLVKICVVAGDLDQEVRAINKSRRAIRAVDSGN